MDSFIRLFIINDYFQLLLIIYYLFVYYFFSHTYRGLLIIKKRPRDASQYYPAPPLANEHRSSEQIEAMKWEDVSPQLDQYIHVLSFTELHDWLDS